MDLPVIDPLVAVGLALLVASSRGPRSDGPHPSTGKLSQVRLHLLHAFDDFPVLNLPIIDRLAAAGLALLVAVLGARALDRTDLNPVSGVGKLSQVRLVPRHCVAGPHVESSSC